MPRFLAVLLVAFALFAPASLQARDDIEYGRYLGVRLRMYDESNKVLDRIIESGTDEEVARARQAKAEVIKYQADNEYPDDDAARLSMYEEAVKVFGDPEEPKPTLAKAVMQLELADSLRRTEPEKAREFCNDVGEALTKHRDTLINVRDDIREDFAPMAETFNSIWYHLGRSYYIKSLTYEMNSDQRWGWASSSPTPCSAA